MEMVGFGVPEEQFVSQEDVSEEGTCIKADWLVWGETILAVW